MNLAMPLLKNLSHVKHLYTMVLLNPKTLLFLHGGMDQKLVGTKEVEPIHQITVQQTYW